MSPTDGISKGLSDRINEYEISKNSLHMMDLSMENLKEGVSGEPLDSSEYDFIENLTMGGATLLYHSVNTSLDMLASNGIPKDLKTVAIVNFTDGLDEGSYTFSNYNSGGEYLRAITQRIRNEKVGGLEISSHTIGIQGDDVFSYDMNEFLDNLNGISSLADEEWPDGYVHYVTSFDEVREAFEAIARSLHQTVENAKLTLNPPAPEPNTRVRFTFDITTTDFNGANLSQKYIEGVYVTGSDGIGVLTNVQYRGVTSSSGNTVRAVRMERPFAIFEFEGMGNTDGSDFNNSTIAIEHMRKAVQLDPNNRQYHQLLQQFRNAEQSRSAQQNQPNDFSMPVLSMGKILIGLLAAQLLFGLLQMLFGMGAHMYYLPG